jgi:hypothetical protein
VVLGHRLTREAGIELLEGNCGGTKEQFSFGGEDYLGDADLLSAFVEGKLGCIFDARD